MQLPLVTGSYEGISTDTSTAELINFYYEPAAQGEQHQGAALPVPGGSRGVTVSAGNAISQLIHNTDPAYQSLFAVVNAAGTARLYEIETNETVTNHGAIGTFTANPQLTHMEVNVFGKEIYVKSASADRGWIFDYTTDTLTQITDTTPPTTSYASAFIDGYFLVSDNTGTNPGRFYWSDLNDGLNWTDTNYATATNLGSDIIDIVVDRGNIYLIGNTKAEIWYNSGDANNTFKRYENLNTGCVTYGTAKQIDNTVMWFSQNERGDYQVIRIGEGSVPEIVSTPELSYTWQDVATAHQPYAYVQQFGGHEFYVLSFRGTNTTWAYDVTTGRWSQRSATFSAGEPVEDFVSNFVFWPDNTDDKFVVTLDTDPGYLYYMRTDEFEWTGASATPIPRRITSPTIRKDRESVMRIAEIELDCETLSGLTDTGIDISWSKDGGKTFTTPRTLDLENERLIARKLGKGRKWVFRIETESEGKVVVKDGLMARMAGEPQGTV